MIAGKEKIVKTLKKSVILFNRWRRIYGKGLFLDLSGSNLRNSNLSNSDLSGSNLSNSDFSNSNLSGSNLSGSNLNNSNLRGADLSESNLRNSNLKYSDLKDADLSNSDLRGADLDFSCLTFSCKTLSAIFCQKQIIQILYHSAKPTENNFIELDEDVLELFNSDLFKKVVNKFHRANDTWIFEGTKKE